MPGPFCVFYSKIPNRLFYNPLHRSLHKFNRQPDYPSGSYVRYQKGFTWRHAWAQKNLVPTTLYKGYDYDAHKKGFLGDSEIVRKREGTAVFSEGTLMKSCDPKSHFVGVDVQLNDDGNEKPYKEARKGNNHTQIGDKKGIVNVRFYCDEFNQKDAGRGLKKMEIDVKSPLRGTWKAETLYPDKDTERDSEKEMPGLFIDVSE